LIKFKTFLRVVVGTGNLHLADWAVWANAFWWRDFPSAIVKKEPPAQSTIENGDAQDFKNTLKLALNYMLP